MAGIWNPLRGARAQKDRADALYRGLMAAALAPEAYAAGVVPDDMEHRVQMVSLHAGLLVWQLTRRPEQPLRRLPQLIHARVFDGLTPPCVKQGSVMLRSPGKSESLVSIIMASGMRQQTVWPGRKTSGAMRLLPY